MITIPPAAGEGDVPTPSPVPLEPDSTSTAIPSQADGRKERMPLVWIPATLCVGLLIAAIYLGGRIVTAHSSSTAAQVKARPPVTHAAPVAPAAPIAPAVVVQAKAEPDAPPAPDPATRAQAEPKPEAPKAEARKPAKAEATKPAKPEPEPLKAVAGEPVPMIAPHDGERYIQVGALDLERTRRYVGHLRDAKLEPHVAPGPTPEMLRILIGPFADRDALASTKSRLDSAGIENFVREY